MGGLSWWHWLIIGGAFILLFGAKKLPDAARGLGRSLRILKSEVGAMSDDNGTKTAETPQTAAVATPAVALTEAPAVQPVQPVAVPVQPVLVGSVPERAHQS